MKTFLSLFLFLNIITIVNAQDFFKQNSTAIVNPNHRTDKPKKELFYNLDIEKLKNKLSEAGNHIDANNVLLNIPTPEGQLNTYKIFEDSVMEASFQAAYPQIKSYAGQGVTNPEEIIRFTITPLGFQAIILNTSNGTQLISPVDLSRNLYSVYYIKDLNFEDFSYPCELMASEFSNQNNTTQNVTFNANDGIMRNFRIAISATAEYSALYNSNLTDVISAMTATVSNANAILGRDLSISLTMVDNTSLIFFDALTDPFTNSDNVMIVDENQLLIDNVIGDSNYDIGHVFNTTGGGLALLSSSCVSFSKATAVTGSPSSDSIYSDLVFLHELGHQFGSPHTFNGDAGACGPNISTSTAVEPGSGSTIMAYPGLCAPQNVVADRDVYYHQASISSMWSHITSFTSCPINQVQIGNNPPTADAGSNYLIPQGTPYKLVGSSMDIDGTDTHTYTWEQLDLGPQGIPDETTLLGPVVRSREGTTNPIRYIPAFEDLLRNPGSQEWERLMTVNRDLNFSLTVRDNDVSGGQTDVDSMTATVTTNAGPFIVTSQNIENQIVWTPGNTETITWNVAGTDANGINEATVNILLSTDEGLTYDTVLAANTPNDGTEDIIVPNIDATKCRIMIEAVNNIFFNINEAFFAIGNYTYDEVCEDFFFNFNSPIPEDALFFTSFPFQINDDITIEDLNFNVNISGQEDNESINFGYIHPEAGFNDLATNICSGTSGLNLTFDDEGNPIDCSNLDSGDNVLPTDPLSILDGETTQGNWLFVISDIDEDGITSHLNSITLSVCENVVIPSLSVYENAIEEFKIYPNPSKGRFNINFNSLISNAINLQVFDITGRLVYSKNYETSNDNFSTSIDLENPISGIYLVKLNQGKNSLVKKLIIH